MAIDSLGEWLLSSSYKNKRFPNLFQINWFDWLEMALAERPNEICDYFVNSILWFGAANS